VGKRIQTDDVEPIEVLVLDSQNQPLTGLTDVKLRVRRNSDNLFFDWSDDTFKNYPSVTTFLQELSEIHSTAAPGKYRLASVNHPNGLDTSRITNANDDDTYFLTAIQDSAVLSASNLPQVGELSVGQWVDHIDWNISDNADPDEVRDVLIDLGLDHLVKTNPGAALPGTGTYIKQILDNLEEKPSYLTLQCYSYNQLADRFDGIVWVEYKNLVFNSADLDSCSVSIYDKDGNLMFTMTDDTPDAQGFFKLEKNGPGLSTDQLYYATATVTITDLGDISGGLGAFSF
jgi:hypothetical protein